MSIYLAKRVVYIYKNFVAFVAFAAFVAFVAFVAAVAHLLYINIHVLVLFLYFI